MTTSLARTAASSNSSGRAPSPRRSMPRSAMAATTAGLRHGLGGRRARRSHHDATAGVVGEKGSGHLRSSGVMNADKEHFWGEVSHAGPPSSDGDTERE
jgi:hypothetical protein